MHPRAPFIPPLALAIILSAASFGLAQLQLAPVAHGPVWLALLVCLLGAVLIALAFYQFRQHKTSVHPMEFSANTSLLTTGVFARTRNPIYLGMLIFMLGLAFIFGDILAFLPCLAFFLWINYWQISVEELHLKRRFGAAYTQYCQQVRRWF